MNPLSIMAPIKGPTGYDAFARDLIEQLDRKGVEIALRQMEHWSPFEISLRAEHHDVLGRALAVKPGNDTKRTNLSICLPEQAELFDDRFNCIYTMFETDAIPHEWALQLQHIDQVIVPTEFNRWTFSRNGLLPAEKIEVLPIGINLERYNPAVEPLPLMAGDKSLLDFPIRFLLVCELTERKNFWGALLAYYSVAALVGPEKCCLVMKIGSYSRQIDLRQEIATFRQGLIDRKEIPDTEYNVFNYTPLLPDEAHPHFIRLGTHYLSTSFGEGWDMTALQAAACGLHLLVPKNSAYQCWLDAETVTFLPIAMKKPATQSGVTSRLYAGSNWATLNLRDSILTIAANITEPAIIEGKQRRMQDGISRYGWDAVIDRYIEVLRL